MRAIAFILHLIALALALAAFTDGWHWHVEPVTGLPAPRWTLVLAVVIMWSTVRGDLPSMAEIMTETALEEGNETAYRVTQVARAGGHVAAVLISWGTLYVLAQIAQ